MTEDCRHDNTCEERPFRRLTDAARRDVRTPVDEYNDCEDSSPRVTDLERSELRRLKQRYEDIRAFEQNERDNGRY